MKGSSSAVRTSMDRNIAHYSVQDKLSKFWWLAVILGTVVRGETKDACGEKQSWQANFAS